MQKDDAERALQLIRKVVADTRDDLVEQNWGQLWMLHAFVNLAAFVTIGLYVDAEGMPLPYYLAPLIVAGAIDGALVLLLGRRDRGIKSFVEWQMHGIWTTFILGTGLIDLALYLEGAPASVFVYVVALTSGIGFAMMGTVFTARFFGVAALFGLAIGVFPFVPSGAVRWIVVGLLWWATLFMAGVVMHRRKRARTGTAKLL